MNTKTDFHTFGTAVAEWVAERTGEPIPASACAETLSTAEAIITACRVPVLIPDLWPVSKLEMLYVPPDDVPAGPAIAASFAGQVSRPVLRAIGRAVRAQFDATETDMLRLELDNGGAVVVFSPEVRDTVTEAEGVTLLSE